MKPGDALVTPYPDKMKKGTSLLLFGSVIAGLLLITCILWKPLTSLLANPSTLHTWIAEHPFSGRLGFLGIRVVQTIITPLPAEAVEIASGYTFGAWEGALLCLMGSALGSAAVFAFVRMLGVRMLEAFIPREKINSLRFLKTAQKRNFLFFLLFLIPGTPKDTLTYFAGVTPIRLPAFLLLTSIARIPSVLSSTLGGNAVGTQQYALAVLIFAATAFISLIGLLCYRHWSKNIEN